MNRLGQAVNERGISIASLSKVTGVGSKTITSYVKLLRPVALQMCEDLGFPRLFSLSATV